MIVYETGTGRLLTASALSRETIADAKEEWKGSDAGLFPFDFNFGDWLIEAVNTGVIKEREVLT